MAGQRIKIQDLIEIVNRGGSVKTGIDVFNDQGTLLLDKDVRVNKVRTLEILMEKGVKSLPTSIEDGGVWDAEGNVIKVAQDLPSTPEKTDRIHQGNPERVSSVEQRLKDIEDLKILAAIKYNGAKESIRRTLGQIKESDGEFDYDEVHAQVSHLVDFFTVTDNPFSYLTREIFSHDDYMYNHSINVCAVGTAVLNRFNKIFSSAVNNLLNAGKSEVYDPFAKSKNSEKNAYRCYYREEIKDIFAGFFLHDIGMVTLPDGVLNKSGKLTSDEFKLIKRHSYDFGVKILEKNHVRNLFMSSIVKNHHAAIFPDESRCYPEEVYPRDIPIHVKIAKLADIYDAMTSKRCYKEAFNQINVVTEIFRKYAGRDPILQYVLHAFLKSIGIYPPGSIVFLRNSQLAYVLESNGPLVIPFTDNQGKTLAAKPDPIDMGDDSIGEDLKVDSRRSVKTPLEVYNLLPTYLKPKT